MESSFDTLPFVYVRLKGKNGHVSEYRGIVNPASEYSFLPKVDAYALGYTEAAYTEYVSRPPNLISFVSQSGYTEAALIDVQEVCVGPISVLQVPFVAFDIQQITGCDVILGTTFLQSLKVEIDYRNKRLRLEKAI